MKVVILAGGFGTRISEESAVRPKPMVEIGDKPILWHIMKTATAKRPRYGQTDRLPQGRDTASPRPVDSGPIETIGLFFACACDFAWLSFSSRARLLSAARSR